MKLLQETLALTWRWFKHLQREPFFVMFTVIQPVFWLVLFGSLFSRTMQAEGNYIDFLTSGIIVMTVMGNSFSAGIPLLFDRENKYLERLLSSPISKWSIVTSRFLFSNILSVIQALIIFSIAFILGAAIPQPLAMAQMLFIALLFGVGLTVISISLAFRFTHHGDFFATIGFLNLPTIFLSSALLPLSLMPQWMRSIALWNPMTYAIEGARAVMTGQGFPLLQSIAGLVLFDALCVLLGSGSLKKL